MNAINTVTDCNEYSFEYPEFTLEIWETPDHGYLVAKEGEEPIGRCNPADTTPEGMQREADRIYAKLTQRQEEPPQPQPQPIAPEILNLPFFRLRTPTARSRASKQA